MQAPQIVPTQRFSYVPKFQPQTFQKTNVAFTPQRQQNSSQNVEFDGKRLRKAVTRKTVDYNSSVIKYLEVSKFTSYLKLMIFICIINFFKLFYCIISIL